MSSPQLFRIWDKFQNKFIYKDAGIIGEFTCFGLMEVTIDQTWEERSKAQGYTNTIEAWNDFEFDWFSGETDLNDVKIYENDICKLIFNEDLEETSPVVFQYGAFTIEADFGDFDMTSVGWAKNIVDGNIIVIGNIRENPELLTP